eukprot:293811-Chlamydomonas_euryale.AAC.4
MPAAQSGIDAQESLRVKHTPPQPPLPPARLRRPTPRARRRSAAAAVASAGREGGSLALSGAKPVGVGSGDSRRGGLLGGRTRKQSRKGSGHACRRGCGCCGWDAAASSNASAASKNGSSPESARASGGGGAPSAACCMVAAAGLAGDRRAFQAASRWPLLARPLRPRCRVNARPRPRIASEKGAQKGICALACQGQVLQRVGWISFDALVLALRTPPLRRTGCGDCGVERRLPEPQPEVREPLPSQRPGVRAGPAHVATKSSQHPPPCARINSGSDVAERPGFRAESLHKAQSRRRWDRASASGARRHDQQYTPGSWPSLATHGQPMPFMLAAGKPGPDCMILIAGVLRLLHPWLSRNI